MNKVFFSTWTTLSLTLIALPGWATNSNSMGSEHNLANVLSYSNSPHSISINQVQKLPQTAGSRLEHKLILAAGKANKNVVVQQKSTSRSSPHRGAPKPKPHRD